MTDVLVSSFFTSFMIVRFMKGPWGRNPQYLAASVFGAFAALLIAGRMAPGIETELGFSNLISIAGAVTAILAFDFALANA